MKPKSESWNEATPLANHANHALMDSSRERGSRRALTRVGLGQLTHVVSGALSSLQGGGSNARASAQNRMKALLNQDRALLSHRAFGEASLLDQPEIVPEVPRKGSATRTAAQNRMRELLNQDRAMLAYRTRSGLEAAGDEDLDVALDFALREESSPAVAAGSTTPTLTTTTTTTTTLTNEGTSPAAFSSRGSCVGVTTSFAPEEPVSSVCTPGPQAKAVAPVQAASVAFAVVEAPAPAATIKSETKGEESGGDPIRTRGMAKLLALQGYRDRALSIYDELLAVEPGNVELRAEADKLRGK